jgi:hypothetical protein
MYALPLVARAENITDLKSLIAYVRATLNSLVPLLFAIAVIGFIWGVIKYIYAGGPQKLSEARNHIIYSVIAIAVMLSIWGLAEMLKNTFFESSRTPYRPPTDGINVAPSGNTYTVPTGSRGTGGNPYWPF